MIYSCSSWPFIRWSYLWFSSWIITFLKDFLQGVTDLHIRLMGVDLLSRQIRSYLRLAWPIIIMMYCILMFLQMAGQTSLASFFLLAKYTDGVYNVFCIPYNDDTLTDHCWSWSVNNWWSLIMSSSDNWLIMICVIVCAWLKTLLPISISVYISQPDVSWQDCSDCYLPISGLWREAGRTCPPRWLCWQHLFPSLGWVTIIIVYHDLLSCHHAGAGLWCWRVRLCNLRQACQAALPYLPQDEQVDDCHPVCQGCRHFQVATARSSDRGCCTTTTSRRDLPVNRFTSRQITSQCSASSPVPW